MIDINGIMQMSENSKTVIIDYNQLTGNNYNYCALSFYIEDESQDKLKFLFNNDFRINGCKVVDYDEINEDYFIANSDFDVNGLPPIFTLSIDRYNGLSEEINAFISLAGNVNQNDLPVKYKICFVDTHIQQYAMYSNNADMIASNAESFMLLRTNPKLTGNIKLVVTDNYNLYIDSFKVSATSVLNKKQYRHQPISSDGNYAHDVYKVFRNLPKGELYNVYSDYYDPHKNYYDPYLQIENIYEYGAEYNYDELYSENMKILAPLYIGKHLPTYFAIFRTDRLVKDGQLDDTALMKNMIKESDCVKIFDLRKSTTIGKYLNNYKQEISKYISGSCSLQFIEQEFDKTLFNYRQGQNTWRGISLDKGVLTEKTETSYFATNILNGQAPQENYSMFLLDGFSRNNMLYPNIINLEFMFNDEQSDDMTMHNYFGLYLTENSFLHFNQILKTLDESNYQMRYYDSDNKEMVLADTPLSVIDNDNYKDRIFFCSTLNDAIRLKTMEDFSLFVKNKVANRPYQNIVQLDGQRKIFDGNQKSFITIEFNAPIKYGEHFKFVKTNTNETDGKSITLELIASNNEKLAYTDSNISQYVLTNYTEQSVCLEDATNELYKIAFYTQSVEDVSQPATLDEQIKRICAAIQKINSFIEVGSYSQTALSLFASKENVYFQHILANEIELIDATKDPLFSDENGNIEHNYVEVKDTLKCFNIANTQLCQVIDYKPNLYRIEDTSFADNGLETTLYRYCSIYSFVNSDKLRNNFVYEISEDICDRLNEVKVPIISTLNGYYPMLMFNTGVSELKLNSLDEIMNTSMLSDNSILPCVISPWNVEKSIIASIYETYSSNGYINICSPMQSNVSIMGISMIKDIDTYINSNTTHTYKSSASAEFAEGEIVYINNSDNRLRQFITYVIDYGHIKGLPLSVSNPFMIIGNVLYYSNGSSVETQQLIDYIEFDKDTKISLANSSQLYNYDYQVNDPVLDEDNYYVDKLNKSTSRLKIPVIPAINCKWKSNGIYFDRQSLLDVNNILNDYTWQGSFNESTYSPASKTNSQYIPNSLDDIIIANGKKMSIKDYIFSGGLIKKYLINNFKIDTAIGYYNPYVQILEFIYYGIKFALKLTSAEYANEIKLNELNNYEVFILNDYSSSDTNDIIISKKEEFILIINHSFESTSTYSSGNVKILDTDVKDATYNWYKAPYNYDLLNISYLNNNVFVHKTNEYALKSIDNVKSIVELDLDVYESSLQDFGEKPAYTYFINNGLTSYDKYDVYDNMVSVFTNDNDIIYTTENNDFSLFAKRYNGKHNDYRQKNTYFVKQSNMSFNETTEQMVDRYIDSFDNNYALTIIDNDVDTIYISKTNKPLSISLTTPNRIKYNQGLFDPNYVDIFNYSITDDISSVIGIDTLYANTCISQIDNISKYYYNKILSSNNLQCMYNYFNKDSRSILQTNWDNDVYRLYDNDTTYNFVPGYSLGIDDKMLFGSKVLNIHNESVSLMKWDYVNSGNYVTETTSAHNMNTEAKPEIQISLNITKTFYNYITNLTCFTDNWKGIDNILNVKVYINNYINNTLSKIYNFKDNFDVNVLALFDSSAVDYSTDEHFVKDTPENIDNYTILDNVTTVFKEVNNEIILTITVSDYQNYLIYPIVKLNKN